MDPSTVSILIGLLICAYLLGSIPFGLVLTRLFTSIDIRQHGSGNIGATNVRRLAGTPLGLLTLAGDVLKGAVPVYIAGIVTVPEILPRETYISLVAMAVFLGHLYPVYMKFKNGGKGVATAFGCISVIAPSAVLTALIAFALVLWLSNRVSAGSLTAAAALPPTVWWATQAASFTGCALLMVVFIYIRHRDNIKRLIDGTESGFRNKSKSR